MDWFLSVCWLNLFFIIFIIIITFFGEEFFQCIIRLHCLVVLFCVIEELGVLAFLLFLFTEPSIMRGFCLFFEFLFIFLTCYFLCFCMKGIFDKISRYLVSHMVGISCITQRHE